MSSSQSSFLPSLSSRRGGRTRARKITPPPTSSSAATSNHSPLLPIAELSEIDADAEDWTTFIIPSSKPKSRRNGVADLSVQIGSSSSSSGSGSSSSTVVPPSRNRALPRPPIIVEDLCHSPDSFHQAFESVRQSFPSPPSASSPAPSLSHSNPSSPASSSGEFPETPSRSVESLEVPKGGRPAIAPLIITKHAFRGIMEFTDSPFKSGTFSVDSASVYSSASFMEDDSDAEDQDDDAGSWYTEQLSARLTLTSPYTPSTSFPQTPYPHSPLDELPPARRDSVTSVIPVIAPVRGPRGSKPLPRLPQTVKRPSSALDPAFAFAAAPPSSRRPPRVRLPADISEESEEADDFEMVEAGGPVPGFEMDLSLDENDPVVGAALRRASSRFVRPPRPALLSLSPPSPPSSYPARSSSPIPLMSSSASISSFAFSFAPSNPSTPTAGSSFPPSAFPESANSPDSELQAQQARLLRSRWSSSTLASDYHLHHPEQEVPKSASDMLKFYFKKVAAPISPPPMSPALQSAKASMAASKTRRGGSSFDEKVRNGGVRRSTSRSSNGSSSQGSPRSYYSGSSDAGSIDSSSSSGLRRKPIPFALMAKID